MARSALGPQRHVATIQRRPKNRLLGAPEELIDVAPCSACGARRSTCTGSPPICRSPFSQRARSRCPGRRGRSTPRAPASELRMADRLAPPSRPRQQGKRRCGSCGKLYVGRPRQEAVCLTCDIRGRAAAGERTAAIAARFGIPRFLVEAVLEPDSHPTRTPRRSAIVDSGRY